MAKKNEFRVLVATDGSQQTKAAIATAVNFPWPARTVSKEHAQLLVVGARGTSGVRHLLLGSVAEGALNRCPVPVVIASRD